MMRALSPAVVVLALAPVAAGCHHKAGAPISPQAEIALTVDNQNFADMDIFVLRRGGERLRIGMVPGLSTRLFMLRPDMVGYGGDVQFEAHPIGGRGHPIGDPIQVHAGDVIRLTIRPS